MGFSGEFFTEPVGRRWDAASEAVWWGQFPAPR